MRDTGALRLFLEIPTGLFSYFTETILQMGQVLLPSLGVDVVVELLEVRVLNVNCGDGPSEFRENRQ